MSSWERRGKLEESNKNRNKLKHGKEEWINLLLQQMSRMICGTILLKLGNKVEMVINRHLPTCKTKVWS